MKVGQVLVLTGKTRHGKNRVREQGDLWRVTKITPALPHGAFPAGSRVLHLETLDGEHWRLVSEHGSTDFDFFPKK
tara:strand:- start:87 stop:314 length:228 start_codon:yes stop_codon:yes gene_type:complete